MLRLRLSPPFFAAIMGDQVPVIATGVLVNPKKVLIHADKSAVATKAKGGGECELFLRSRNTLLFPEVSEIKVVVQIDWRKKGGVSRAERALTGGRDERMVVQVISGSITRSGVITSAGGGITSSGSITFSGGILSSGGITLKSAHWRGGSGRN